MNIAHFDNTIFYHGFDNSNQSNSVLKLSQLGQTCQNTLVNCPNVLAYLHKTWGIGLDETRQYHIGYFDKALPLNDSSSCSKDEINYSEYETLRGCITSPINVDGELLGIHGFSYKSSNSHSTIKHLLEPNVILEPIHFSKSILRCLNPLDVISLQKHGYQNAYCDLSGNLSELTFDRLHQFGVEIVVYFTDAYGADFDVTHASELAKYYRIRLCEVNLPFTLTNFGQWDTFQWQLFDRRLSQCLKLSGAYNERYQA